MEAKLILGTGSLNESHITYACVIASVLIFGSVYATTYIV